MTKPIRITFYARASEMAEVTKEAFLSAGCSPEQAQAAYLQVRSAGVPALALPIIRGLAREYSIPLELCNPKTITKAKAAKLLHPAGVRRNAWGPSNTPGIDIGLWAVESFGRFIRWDYQVRGTSEALVSIGLKPFTIPF